jgi:hypothetical protein
MEELVFYRVLLPLPAACNLGLGVVTLDGLGRPGWIGALELGTGAVCCAIGGGLVSAAISKCYWTRAMRRQVAVWRLVSDALVLWLDETRVTDEALARLHASLTEALVANTRTERTLPGSNSPLPPDAGPLGNEGRL